jgi:hypothetical protein
MSGLLALVLILFSMAAGSLLLTSEDWRLRMTALLVVYAVLFFLVLQIWPAGLATIKLVSGWVAAVVLFVPRFSQREPSLTFLPRPVLVFRILSAVLMMVVILAVTPSVSLWLPAPYPFLHVGLLLIGLGLLQIGISQDALPVILGLLTILAGFETVYSTLEGSALLAAILAAITLALGLVGSFYVNVEREDQV